MKSFLLILIVSTLLLFGFDSINKESRKIIDDNIIVLVKYKAQPEKSDMAISELIQLIDRVKQEPHFVKIKLHVDPNDNTNILLYEEWSDASYYNTEHMNTTHLQEFIANSRNFLGGPPEISFWKVEQEFK